jgi:NADH-quinone oxidoreductase subunit M
MFGFGILSGLLILPLVGAAFILTLRGDEASVRSNARMAALITTIITFALALVAWNRFDTASAAIPVAREPRLAVGNDPLQARR